LEEEPIETATTNQRVATRRPFEAWAVEELAYLEETLNDAYKDSSEFLRDEVPNMNGWYEEQIEQVSDLLDRCGIPFRENTSFRELGVQGYRASEQIARIES